jgi:hypothetical protein
MFKNTYKALLEGGKAAIDAALLPIRVATGHKKFEMNILKTEETILQAQNAYYQECAKEELDPQACYDAREKWNLAKRKRDILKKIKEELFPDGDVQTTPVASADAPVNLGTTKED